MACIYTGNNDEIFGGSQKSRKSDQSSKKSAGTGTESKKSSVCTYIYILYTSTYYIHSTTCSLTYVPFIFYYTYTIQMYFYYLYTYVCIIGCRFGRVGEMRRVRIMAVCI